jgi:hypothetical protein
VALCWNPRGDRRLSVDRGACRFKASAEALPPAAAAALIRHGPRSPETTVAMAYLAAVLAAGQPVVALGLVARCAQRGRRLRS